MSVVRVAVHRLGVLLLLALTGNAAAAPHDFPQANLSLNLPDGEWTQTVSDQKVSPHNTAVAAFQSKRGVTISVLSARYLPTKKLIFREFVEGLKGGLAPPAGKLTRTETTTFGGVPAVRIQGTMTAKGHSVALHILTYQVGETAWTVTCSAPSANTEGLREALDVIRVRGVSGGSSAP